MELIDIVTVPITDQIIADAKNVASYMDTKKAKEHTVFNGNGQRVDRNFIGQVGHGVAELAFSRYNVGVNSTRNTKYVGGDSYDLEFVGDFIDVKSHSGKLNEQFFFNEKMLVFDYQLQDEKIAEVSHFCFVRVDLEEMLGYVFGLIPLRGPNGFLNISKPLKLTYDNHFVLSRQLTPLRQYIFRC